VGASGVTPEDIPAYSELILLTVRAVADLGRSAKAREITNRVLESLPESEQLLALRFQVALRGPSSRADCSGPGPTQNSSER